LLAPQHYERLKETFFYIGLHKSFIEKMTEHVNLTIKRLDVV